MESDDLKNKRKADALDFVLGELHVWLTQRVEANSAAHDRAPGNQRIVGHLQAYENTLDTLEQLLHESGAMVSEEEQR